MKLRREGIVLNTKLFQKLKELVIPTILRNFQFLVCNTFKRKYQSSENTKFLGGKSVNEQIHSIEKRSNEQK